MRTHQRLIAFVLTLVAGLAGALVVAPDAFAGTISSPTGNPFVVPTNASGQPVAFTISGTGFAADTDVFVEQCDGVAPTDVGWDPTQNCDLGSSPAPAHSNGSGAVTFSATDVNRAFKPFTGPSPQGLFNCLGPTVSSPGNGLPDFRNCKIRLATNNTLATGDQVFLNIQLPNALTTPTEIVNCGLRGSVALKPFLTDVAPKKPKANKVKGDATVGTAAGGSCTSTSAAAGATKYTVSSGSVKIKGAFPVGSKCAALAAPPIAGTELKIKWQGINPKKNKLTTAGKTIAHVSSVSATGPNTYGVVAPVVTGAFTGKTVRLTLRTDKTVAALTSSCQSAGLASIGFTGIGASTITVT